MTDAHAFAREAIRRLVTRSQEYMELARSCDDTKRERLITKAVAYSEIADLLRLAAIETWGEA